MSLQIEIITPEGIAYTSIAFEVYIPTSQGIIGILPGHQPLLTDVVMGSIEVLGAKTEKIAVDNGFVSIRGDRIYVLTESAIHVEKIDLEAIAKAKQRAQETLADNDLDIAEKERLEAVVRFSIFQELIKTNLTTKL